MKSYKLDEVLMRSNELIFLQKNYFFTKIIIYTISGKGIAPSHMFRFTPL